MMKPLTPRFKMVINLKIALDYAREAELPNMVRLIEAAIRKAEPVDLKVKAKGDRI